MRNHNPSKPGVNLLLLLGSMLLAEAPAISAETTVMVIQPEKSRLVEELELTGTLTARYRARLSTRIDGLIQQVLVETGDHVSAGDPLLRLDTEMEQIALQQAQANTSEARAREREAIRRVEEARELIKKRHIAQSELASRESSLAYARASLASARAAERTHEERIRRHVLPAPFDGVIVRKMAEAGEWVNRGAAVFELVNPHEVWLDVKAPQEYFGALARALDVQIRPDALPGEVLTGRIATRVPVSDGIARTFLVRVLASSKQGLLPGSSATAVIRVPAGGSDTLFVPNDALLRHPDGRFSVFAVEQQGNRTVARRRNVSVGQVSDLHVEITKGLKPEEFVVVRGNEILRDGDPVKVITISEDGSV